MSAGHLMEASCDIFSLNSGKMCLLLLQEYGAKQVEQQDRQASVCDLCKTPKLRFRFIILIVMWYVIDSSPGEGMGGLMMVILCI